MKTVANNNNRVQYTVIKWPLVHAWSLIPKYNSLLTELSRILFKTLDSMATPFSINAIGKYFRASPRFRVAICELEKIAEFNIN